jgi:hypothetical protein
MGQFLRSLHRWIERKFQVTLHHKHVAAHQGEPGNELVDCLAFQAAGGTLCMTFGLGLMRSPNLTLLKRLNGSGTSLSLMLGGMATR